MTSVPSASRFDGFARTLEATAAGERQGSHRLERPRSRQPPPSEPSVQAGDVLDEKYCLLHALSVGGMGTLFVAHNAILDVRVAIKLMRRVDDEDGADGLEGRLLLEARAAARLGHPAIVRVFDFGRTPLGEPYIVMELLQGEDLGAALARRGRIGPTQAARVLLPIAHALWTAHGRDIVHRDVKPANVFLAQTDEGTLQPKLIDFGVAKMQQPVSDRLTLIGTCVGTPEYMSPELARGEDVGADADIWAFCVLLYELVTGTIPFGGANVLAVLHAVVGQPPQPIAAHGVDDPEFWAILSKGLQKDRAERWSSMREIGQALALMLLERGVPQDICGAALDSTWLEPSHPMVASDGLSSFPPASSREQGTSLDSARTPALAPPASPRSIATLAERRAEGQSPLTAVPAASPPGLGSRRSSTSTPPPAAASGERVESTPEATPRSPSIGALASRRPDGASSRGVVTGAASALAAEPGPDSFDAAAMRRAIVIGFALVALAILLVGGAAVAVWAWRTSLLERGESPPALSP